jgi:hypothetical protein
MAAFYKCKGTVDPNLAHPSLIYVNLEQIVKFSISKDLEAEINPWRIKCWDVCNGQTVIDEGFASEEDAVKHLMS